MGGPHVSVSRWDVARVSTSCPCREVIGAGEAIYLFGPRQQGFCARCANRRFGKDAPPEMPAPTVREALRMTRAVDALPRDFKIAQSKDGE